MNIYDIIYQIQHTNPNKTFRHINSHFNTTYFISTPYQQKWFTQSKINPTEFTNKLHQYLPHITQTKDFIIFITNTTTNPHIILNYNILSEEEIITCIQKATKNNAYLTQYLLETYHTLLIDSTTTSCIIIDCINNKQYELSYFIINKCTYNNIYLYHEYFLKDKELTKIKSDYELFKILCNTNSKYIKKYIYTFLTHPNLHYPQTILTLEFTEQEKQLIFSIFLESYKQGNIHLTKLIYKAIITTTPTLKNMSKITSQYTIAFLNNFDHIIIPSLNLLYNNTNEHEINLIQTYIQNYLNTILENKSHFNANITIKEFKENYEEYMHRDYLILQILYEANILNENTITSIMDIHLQEISKLGNINYLNYTLNFIKTILILI